jgi:hypothetical protein
MMPDTPHRAALRTGALYNALLSVGSEFVECTHTMASLTRTLRNLLPLDLRLADALRAAEERCEALCAHAHVLIYGSPEGQSILMARLAPAPCRAIIPLASTSAFAWAWAQPPELILRSLADEFRAAALQMQQILLQIDTRWFPQAGAPWRELWQEGKQVLEGLSIRLCAVTDEECIGILLPRIMQEQLLLSGTT